MLVLGFAAASAIVFKFLLFDLVVSMFKHIRFVAFTDAFETFLSISEKEERKLPPEIARMDSLKELGDQLEELFGASFEWYMRRLRTARMRHLHELNELVLALNRLAANPLPTGAEPDRVKRRNELKSEYEARLFQIGDRLLKGQPFIDRYDEDDEDEEEAK